MITALIPAAGKSAKENALSPTDTIGGVSSIRRIISVFKQAGIEKIVVVSGDNAGVLERHCAHMGAIFLRNDTYVTGDMLSSTKIGLRYLKGKCRSAFIAPVHFPFFSDETVISMKNIPAPIVIPVFNKRKGHPLLIAESLFDGILDYDGLGGLEGYLSNSGAGLLFDVSDEGVVVEAQQPLVNDEIIAKHSLRNIRPETVIKLSGEKDFFDSETLQLLKLTHDTGSLKHAAKHMGISYSKAWKMIADVETQLGFVVLRSRQGGRSGGGSEITEEALAFISLYETFASECNESVKLLFDRHFKAYFSR